MGFLLAAVTFTAVDLVTRGGRKNEGQRLPSVTRDLAGGHQPRLTPPDFTAVGALPSLKIS